jgi:hypothetical protein
MGVHPKKQRAVDLMLRSVQANRLADGQDMPFVERLVERRTAVPGGAEGHPLRRDRRIGHVGVVGGDEPWHVDQHSRRGRLSGQWTDVH